MLQKQFSSVYSNPNMVEPENMNFIPPEIIHIMNPEDYILTDADLLNAISELNESSAPGPDNVPAVLMKKCAISLLTLLKLMWQSSFESGIVPKFYKFSYVAPLYKKGDRACPSNYRPISLTSHIIIIYERLLRKKIVQFLESNNILYHNQHGFRSGKSCLTQILSHFDSIYEGLQEGADTNLVQSFWHWWWNKF